MMFTPRTSVFSPTSMYGNDWWYDVTKNPFAGSQSLWLPNCTTYAYGRAGEIRNQRQNLPTGNAGEWFPEAQQRGFSTGRTPKIGAIACWEDIAGGSGHVAVVENLRKNPDGSFYDVYVSESFYNTDKSFRPDFPYFRYAFLYDVNTNQPYLSWMLRADYNFQGYIYILPETAGLDPVTIALLGNRRRRFKRR